MTQLYHPCVDTETNLNATETPAYLRLLQHYPQYESNLDALQQMTRKGTVVYMKLRFYPAIKNEVTAFSEKCVEVSMLSEVICPSKRNTAYVFLISHTQ